MKMELSFDEIIQLINQGNFRRTPYEVESIVAVQGKESAEKEKNNGKLILDVKVGKEEAESLF